MTINEKAIYLKGLADGLNFDKETAEGKLIAALIDLCADMAKKLDEVDEDIEYLKKGVIQRTKRIPRKHIPKLRHSQRTTVKQPGSELKRPRKRLIGHSADTNPGKL